MQSMQQFLMAAGAALTLATAALATPMPQVTPTTNPVQVVAQPKPLLPKVLINEVSFDQTGDDNTPFLGSEFVELYTTQQIQLDNFSLTDNQGNAFARLPTVTVPAKSLVLIILGGGQNAYNPDDVISDKTGAYMLGMTPGDYLGNSAGGVRLLNSNGKIVDAVYWGTGSAPSGATGPYWGRGTYVDISMAGSPMGEGDSIGRSSTPSAQFTGTVGDWERHGGRNAAGPSPKAVNSVAGMTQGTMIKWVQAGVNRIVTGYGTESQPGGWFNFTGSSVGNVLLASGTNSISVTADHTFSIEVWGSPTILSGQIVSTYSWNPNAGSVSHSRTAQGMLTSPAGFSFDIDHSEDVSGYHTNMVTGVYSTDVIYNDGTAYAFSVDTVESLTRTGLNTWVNTDARTAVDYGGAGPKTSDRTTTVTRTADGAYTSTCVIDRDYPMGPPAPGSSDSIYFRELKQIDTVSNTLDDFGEFDSTITRYDVSVGGSVITSLQKDSYGSSSLRFNGASTSEPLGSADFQMTLPLDKYGVPCTISGTAHSSMELNGNAIVFTSINQIDVDGWTAEYFNYSIDPPQELPDAEPEEGFLDAVGDCAAKGAGIGAGAGAVVGGVAGGIGGAAVGTAIGTLGGPPGMVAAGTGGGVGGAAAGGFVGAGAGAVVGTAAGALCCGIGNLWDKIF